MKRAIALTNRRVFIGSLALGTVARRRAALAQSPAVAPLRADQVIE